MCAEEFKGKCTISSVSPKMRWINGRRGRDVIKQMQSNADGGT